MMKNKLRVIGGIILVGFFSALALFSAVGIGSLTGVTLEQGITAGVDFVAILFSILMVGLIISGMMTMKREQTAK